MKKILRVVICLVLTMMLDYRAQGLSDIKMEIEPSRLELQLSPMGNATGTILLKNKSDQPILISAATYDWDMDINGIPAFFAASQKNDSCAGWIAFNPCKFKIESGKQQIVRFSVTPPPGAKTGEYRGAVFFNTQTTVIDKKNPVGLVGNIPVALYCNFSGVQRNGRILKAESQYDAKLKTIWSLLEMESIGTAHIRYQGSFTVKEATGKTVASGDYNDNVVFPGRKQLLKSFCRVELVPGKYIVESIIKFQPPLYADGDNRLSEYSNGLTQLRATSGFIVKKSD